MDGIEEVKSRLSVEDVVGDYVELKRAGRNWRGLSPFTSEKTPSLMVSPEKQIWHDFSSGKGGNMFGFVMEMEGLDFRGALELLARKAGVDLDQYRKNASQRGPNKARLHELLEMSTKFYQVQFSRNDVALAYVLRTRRFTKETALTWRFGYAPNNGTALFDFLSSKDFTLAEMQQAGVVTRRRSGVGDMFRGRLMIPLQDPFGAVIGFTARLLEDLNDAPKYINTPQTVLYDKSRHVFGFHLAKESIRKDKFVVVAEGNLDVIASYQVGVRNVVAAAGTALTEQHLKGLSRFTDDIRLSFDSDRAGLAATERAIPIASKVGVSLSIINIPSGKDPDELIKQDAKEWEQAITERQYALDWLVQRYSKLLDIKTAQGKRQFSDVLLPVVRGLSDQVEQDHYLSAIASIIGVRREALEAKFETTSTGPKLGAKRKRQSNLLPTFDIRQAEYLKTQEHLLCLAFMHSELRNYLDIIAPEMMMGDDAKQLLMFLRTNSTFKDDSEVVVQLKPIGEYVKIITLQYEELYQDLDPTELRGEVMRLRMRLVEAYVKYQKQKLATQLEQADEVQTASVLERAKHLDLLLRGVKGGS